MDERETLLTNLKNDLKMKKENLGKMTKELTDEFIKLQQEKTEEFKGIVEISAAMENVNLQTIEGINYEMDQLKNRWKGMEAVKNKEDSLRAKIEEYKERLTEQRRVNEEQIVVE